MKQNKFIFFWGGEYSQWYKSPFTVDGVKYNCAEQYMMAQKATIFADGEILKKILSSKNPKEQKALGRKVRNFNPEIWNDVARDFVYEANYAKFTQNPVLKQLILSTGDAEFVEASPMDNIWGIGMAEDHPDIMDKSKWKGTNWLGEILTEVRNDIRIEENKNN